MPCNNDGHLAADDADLFVSVDPHYVFRGPCDIIIERTGARCSTPAKRIILGVHLCGRHAELLRRGAFLKTYSRRKRKPDGEIVNSEPEVYK